MFLKQPRKSVVYIQYTNPAGYPPLEHSSRILADLGWKVTFVGCGASGEADRFEFPPHDNINVLRWKFPKPGWRQKLHFFLWIWWAVWVTIRVRASLIYASEPLSCPAAWVASYLPGRKLIYHEHDSPSDKGLSRFMKSLLRYRKRVCDRAIAAILPNVVRARVFQETVQPGCPVLVVWNCPLKGEIKDYSKMHTNKFVLFYHGSLNQARLPLTVLDALTLLPSHTVLHFAGYTTRGAPYFIQEYLDAAQKRGLGERVKYLGAPKMRSELLDLCYQADLGLAFMPIQSDDLNMVAMIGASNKPFDYLACGLNLLVSDLPEWRDMFVRSSLALACNPDDATGIEKAVKWYLNNPSESRIMRIKGQDSIINDWNYEKQFKPVLDILLKNRKD